MVDVFDPYFQDLRGAGSGVGPKDQGDDPRANTVKKITEKGPDLDITNVQFPGQQLELHGDFAPPKIILPGKDLGDPSQFRADCITHNKS